MLTLQAKLKFNSVEDKEKVLDLMRRWSACMRFAYNRLLEGADRNTLKRELQGIFNLNSRYVDSAIRKAQELLSTKARGKSPRKIIFGSRSLFRKLQKKHINGKVYEKLRMEWVEKRKGNLWSIGEEAKKGNLNARIVEKDGVVCLRINLGNRDYVYVPVSAGYKKGQDRAEILRELSEAGILYSVELKLKNENIYVFFSFEENLPELLITKDYGVIGVDLNVYPHNIAWAEVDEKGNLISYGNISMPELSAGSRSKKEYYRWYYAHQIVSTAKEKGKAIVVERLSIANKGKRGDFSGRKSRRIRHEFSYRSMLDKIKILARRNGIQVIEVNPAFTSIIGSLKYAPQYMITKDEVAAFVIARRALGKRERIPKNYLEFLKSLKKEDLEVLKEFIKKRVRNKALKNKHLNEISRILKIYQSPENEPGRLSLPLDGTSKGNRFNLWRVLRVAVVTPLSPEKSFRDFSTLKSLLLQGKWGDPLRTQVPVSWDRGYGRLKYRQLGQSLSERRTTNTPAPELCSFVQFR
ncbi:IS200/IS605 family accessory protein TnpB-related protein [Thermodesulfobacterium thermophilum]|uniref:IS200/IS605 family accessory protein TnpB-related protein n=1 Tax=Thermodesulfobacterium thermophilum TaxID=886 RepID=UPI0003B45C95